MDRLSKVKAILEPFRRECGKDFHDSYQRVCGSQQYQYVLQQLGLENKYQLKSLWQHGMHASKISKIGAQTYTATNPFYQIMGVNPSSQTLTKGLKDTFKYASKYSNGLVMIDSQTNNIVAACALIDFSELNALHIYAPDSSDSDSDSDSNSSDDDQEIAQQRLIMQQQQQQQQQMRGTTSVGYNLWKEFDKFYLKTLYNVNFLKEHSDPQLRMLHKDIGNQLEDIYWNYNPKKKKKLEALYGKYLYIGTTFVKKEYQSRNLSSFMALILRTIGIGMPSKYKYLIGEGIHPTISKFNRLLDASIVLSATTDDIKSFVFSNGFTMNDYIKEYINTNETNIRSENEITKSLVYDAYIYPLTEMREKYNQYRWVDPWQVYLRDKTKLIVQDNLEKQQKKLVK